MTDEKKEPTPFTPGVLLVMIRMRYPDIPPLLAIKYLLWENTVEAHGERLEDLQRLLQCSKSHASRTIRKVGIRETLSQGQCKNRQEDAYLSKVG